MKKSFCALMALIILLTAASCASKYPNRVFSAADLEGKTVGVLEGTASESYLRGMSGSVYIKIFANKNSLVTELKSGGVDAVLADGDTASSLLRYSGLTSLDTPYVDSEYCIAVSEDNSVLYEAVNAAIVNLKMAGVLRRLNEDWENGKATPYVDENVYKDTLTIAVSDDFWPYSFVGSDGTLQGLEIDVARKVCTELGVNADFKIVKANMILYMAESGKVSFSIGRLSPDNASVLYTESYTSSKQEIIVRK